MPKRLANPVEYLTNPAKHGTYTEGDYVQRLRKAQTLIQEALFILDAPSGHAAGSITERDPGNAAWYRGFAYRGIQSAQPCDRLRRGVRTAATEAPVMRLSNPIDYPQEPVPAWVADEIRATWRAARDAHGQLEAFRILERMVDRLGYGRRDNNPSLLED